MVCAGEERGEIYFPPGKSLLKLLHWYHVCISDRVMLLAAMILLQHLIDRGRLHFIKLRAAHLKQ